MKKFFSVNVSEEQGSQVQLHDTLKEAKQACLDGAKDFIDWVSEHDRLDSDAIQRVSGAIYGEVKGTAKVITREPDPEDEWESQYDFIYDGVEIKERI